VSDVSGSLIGCSGGAGERVSQKVSQAISKLSFSTLVIEQVKLRGGKRCAND
jgi:hypothetical protein